MVFIPIPSTEREANHEIEGIGRGNYVISIVGITILAGVAYASSGSSIWGYTYGTSLALFPTFLRLKNLEWSSLILTVVFLPGINILLALALVILPEDYAKTRKLDRDAKVVLTFCIVFVLLITLFFGSINFRNWRNSQPAMPSQRDKR
jgi:hypothetical protein